MCKSQQKFFYLVTFFACFLLAFPLIAQEEQEEPQVSAEVTVYGKVIKAEVAEEAPAEGEEEAPAESASLEVQELLASHQKGVKARRFVLHKDANSTVWADVEKYVGQEVKLTGTIADSATEPAEGEESSESLAMTLSAIEPLTQLIGKLSQAEAEGAFELKEEPKGILFKSGRSFMISNAQEYPEIESFLDQKILARGTSVTDESGQLSLNLWDVRTLIDLECTLFDKKDEQGVSLGMEIENSADQKRYLLNKEDSTGAELAALGEGKRAKVCGYIETLESGEENFHVVQYEVLPDEAEPYVSRLMASDSTRKNVEKGSDYEKISEANEIFG